MIQRILTRNKRTYIKYNNFRKKIFAELAPKDSEAILYMLPWLLSVNHPSCPGYIEKLQTPFRVFNIDNDTEIRHRESAFKRHFGVKQKSSLLIPPEEYCVISGLYTIGSIGTISQTSGSDCDIWVCFDKNEFDQGTWDQLNQKLYLIKDWIDTYLKMPVFFFLSDINDIKQGHYGSVDAESSGSTQKNVLKEEFYRTCMLICGKIPLWWLCFDPTHPVDYDKAVSLVNAKTFETFDIIDFGNLEKIENNEYFGAALWQLHKSLTRPLKSIIKMVLLKMLLDAPQERLICHQFRNNVLSSGNAANFQDFSAFTMAAIFDYYKNNDKSVLEFFKQCCYLRCEIHPYDSTVTIKKKLSDDLFKAYPIDRKTKLRLSKFSEWNFEDQIDLGNQLFKFLLHIYTEISASQAGVATEIDKQDMTIIGRKISACYQPKPDKITVIKKPTGSLNLTNLTLMLENSVWNVYSGTDRKTPLVSSPNIVYNITFIVWNNLFIPNNIQMEPNASKVTLQEIINIGNKIRDFIGTYDVSGIDYPHYLKKERISKILISVSFEKSPWNKDINDFCIVYTNTWGEVFVKRFNSPGKLKKFIREADTNLLSIATTYYVQRSCTSYEKIIERTKKVLFPTTGFGPV
ncbi:MAG: class I adenylate cyclase [Desulfobacterales bacterium]|nr:class I adenylate cyclase [Desulfobacterales bacterium]